MYYLDTSALVKFVFAEEESAALDTFVASRDLAVSALSRVELRRVALKVSPTQLPSCREATRVVLRGRTDACVAGARRHGATGVPS